jgi:hypothetical protein
MTVSSVNHLSMSAIPPKAATTVVLHRGSYVPSQLTKSAALNESSNMDVFAEYKPLRNKISLLARDDALRVIWAYCQYFQIDD